MNLLRYFIIILLSSMILTGCNRGSSNGTQLSSTPAQSTSSEADGATVDAEAKPTFAPPALPLDESPLSGVPDLPNILIVAARQSKSDLAVFLHTTPEQLSRVNPRLSDPIDAGTLIVIPPTYHTNGETLSEISEKTGLAEDVLLSANPTLDPNHLLDEEMILLVPQLYILPEDTSVTSAATAFGVQHEALLSANPELNNESVLSQGTVLVVPPSVPESK